MRALDAARLERFALFGLAGGSPTAIEYAVRNPERHAKLRLSGKSARAAAAARFSRA